MSKAKCKTCKYRGYLGNGTTARGDLYCDYISYEKHSRGCEAGDNCDKYVRGNPETHRRRVGRIKVTAYNTF